MGVAGEEEEEVCLLTHSLQLNSAAARVECLSAAVEAIPQRREERTVFLPPPRQLAAVKSSANSIRFDLEISLRFQSVVAPGWLAEKERRQNGLADSRQSATFASESPVFITLSLLQQQPHATEGGQNPYIRRVPRVPLRGRRNPRHLPKQQRC